MAVAKEQIRQIISENNISSVADVYALLKDSFKDILQELMEAELDATLGYKKNQKDNLQTDNKRNGYSTKNLKSQYGEFQIDVPRDRNGEFEPKLIPKYQRDISGIEEKVISLYARGMSTRDIHDQLQDLYGIELSAEMVSKITDNFHTYRFLYTERFFRVAFQFLHTFHGFRPYTQGSTSLCSLSRPF